MIYQSATSHGLGTRFRTFALANIWGGMTLSGPNDCRGSTKDARTYECKVNERWPDEEEVAVAHLSRFLALAGYRSRKWIVDSKWHLLHRLYASEMSSLCFFTTVEGGAW